MKNLMNISLLLIAAGLSGQTLENLQYGAYLTTGKTMWEKSVKEASEKFGEESFEKALALYGLLNNTMASQDEETFDAHKDGAIDLLKKLIEDNPNWGEPKAVLSSTYGLVMAYSPMKGMFLGMKSTSLIEEALKQQPTSPLVQKLYAGSKLYTPEMFGGDPEEAVESFSVSIELYEGSQTQSNNWLYLDALMGLSMAYRKTDQPEKAVEVLKKALKVEPDYKWAEAVLAKLEKS